VLGHRLLFLCRHRLGEIRPGRNETQQEQPVIHSAARVAGCMAISPNPLRRLHIAASSEYAFSPSSSVNSGAYDSHTCLAPMCALGSPVQYQCRSSPPSPQPRRSYSVIQVLRISDPSASVTHSWVRRIGSCQQTSGFIVSGSTPIFSALLCSAHPIPPSKPGRLR